MDRPEALRVATAVADHWRVARDRRWRVEQGWRRELDLVGMVAIERRGSVGRWITDVDAGRINGVNADIGDAALHDDQRAKKVALQSVRIRSHEVVQDCPEVGAFARVIAFDEFGENVLTQLVTSLQGIQL